MRRTRRTMIAILTLVVVLVATASPQATASSAAPAPASTSAAACTPAQKASATKALRVFKRTLAAKRKAHFRTHASRKSRKAFVKRQNAKLKRLQTAARCQLAATKPPSTPPPPPPPPPSPPPPRPLIHVQTTFVIGAGVTADHQAVIQRGLDIGATYFRSALGRDLPPITVYVEDDYEGMAQLFAATAPAPIDAARRFWATATAAASARRIYVYVGSSSWSPQDDRGAKILAHEAFHILQQELAGKAVNAGVDVVPAAGPRWMEEGTAEYVAFKALAAQGLIRIDDIRAEWITRTKITTGPLQSRETSNGLLAQPEPYEISPLAVDSLIGARADTLVVAYYEAIGRSEPWQAAFAAAFGKGVDTFYAEFEAYRAGL